MARKKQSNGVPTFDKMLIPTLQALKSLGGSGSIEEINEHVYEILNFDDETLAIPHKENDSRSKVDYRLAWARTYLKKYGLIENSSRGVWALIDNDISISGLQANKIVRFVREKASKASKLKIKDTKQKTETVDEEINNQLGWKEELIAILLEITPSAFERLCQRVLRESGFTQVEVTGKSGDGGIDGKGIAKINGFLSFHVFFQCKRYKTSVGSSDIRDFRGAMQGRADKGLFITTSSFTREAIKEATRDGAPPIDLIDGNLFCEKLKEFSLGVKTEIIEEVSITCEWFEKI
ncbi:MAG TPA: restriction endonuclease [Sphingobacterium sp.]|nr:restriction endonuclease [Sphingobacterium sp.]